MRTPAEQKTFEGIDWAGRSLNRLHGKQREDLGDALMMLVFDRKTPMKGQAAFVLADRIKCLLSVCPMTPKEMGRLIGVDAETAVFKNALTTLRQLGYVKATGDKHERTYRLTSKGAK